MRILVTGGSGTLGRAVCKRLVKLGNTVIAYSRDRSKQLENCPGCILEVGDIKDIYRLRQTLTDYDVEAVVHCAANKHVDVCEKNPSVAFGSILGGTHNLLRALSDARRPIRSIFISSDKACHRDQTYGMCKYLAERVVDEYSTQLQGKVNSIRFANLFGSNGSVVPVWKARIDRGEDVQLRLFDGNPALRIGMLPSQAADLTIRALFNDVDYQTGTVLFPPLLSMKVVNIRTLAEVMTKGTNSKIVEADAGPGESRQESLATRRELLYLASNDVSKDVPLCEIGKVRQGDEAPEVPDLEEFAMNKVKTAEFCRAVLKEMQQWT